MKTGYVILCWIARIALAALFFWAGWAKLLHTEAFADGIEGFHFFPAWTVNVLAMSVPILEMTVAGLLLSGWWSRQGALLGVFLGLTFALLFVWAGIHGLQVDCACFGSTSGKSSDMTWGVFRAALIVIFASLIYLERMGDCDRSERVPAITMERRAGKLPGH